MCDYTISSNSGHHCYNSDMLPAEKAQAAQSKLRKCKYAMDITGYQIPHMCGLAGVSGVWHPFLIKFHLICLLYNILADIGQY